MMDINYRLASLVVSKSLVVWEVCVHRNTDIIILIYDSELKVLHYKTVDIQIEILLKSSKL